MLNPPDPEAERLLANAARAYAAGDKPGAAALARQMLLRRPGDARALQLLGAVALDAGDAATARRHLEASNAATANAATLNMIGVAAKQLGDTAAARAAFKRAGELGLIDGWRNLALAAAGDGAAVMAAYEKALALAPDDPGAHAGLAQACEARHDLVRARKHAEAALRRDAGNAVARLALARVLMREKDFAAAEAALAPILQSTRLQAEQRIVALGLIGDARDRAGDADRAFSAFTAANQLSLQINGAWLSATERLYHPDNVERVRSLVEAWPSEPAAPRTFHTPAPIFLVGFPRSGTTLLDQILSSHPGIVCLEESEHFSDALGAVLTTPERAWDIGAITDAEIDQIRDGYWRLVGKAIDVGERLVVDKFPLNIVVLPWIKRVFPDSRVIFALRDPRDVVLSCYQQRFGMNAAMAQFLQLDTAAAYYDRVMSLMELCRDRLGLDLHQVRYEDVVTDLDSAARRLSGFLDVVYEPGMLDFRATALKRDIATPSARQVIEPLYNRSIGRWRRYQTHLAPVLPQLNAWAARYGYSI